MHKHQERPQPSDYCLAESTEEDVGGSRKVNCASGVTETTASSGGGGATKTEMGILDI